MLRPLDGLAIQLSITIPKPEAFAPGFGLVVARMAAAAGPVLRALHRAAYDLDFSSRARHTAAAGLLYMCEPLDFLPLNADRSPERAIDNLYAGFAALRQLAILEGPAAVVRHWRPEPPVQEGLVLLAKLDEVAAYVPPIVLGKVQHYLDIGDEAS